MRLLPSCSLIARQIFQSTHPARGATRRWWRGRTAPPISIHAPREGCDGLCLRHLLGHGLFQSTHPARGATKGHILPGGHLLFQSTHPARGATKNRCPLRCLPKISIHAPREGCDSFTPGAIFMLFRFQSTHPARGATSSAALRSISASFQSTHPARGATPRHITGQTPAVYFNPRTPRGVRQQTLPKSREFAWLNLLICTRGRRLSIQKQTRLCSIKLSFMLFGCEPAGEGVSSWTSHATKSKVRLEGRSAYSQSARSSAHSDFPGNKSGDCPVRGP